MKKEIKKLDKVSSKKELDKEKDLCETLKEFLQKKEDSKFTKYHRCRRTARKEIRRRF